MRTELTRRRDSLRVCTWQHAHEEAFSFSVLYNEPKPRKLRNLPQVTRQEGRSRNLRPSLFPKPVQYTATGSIRKDYQPHKSSAVSQMRQQWGPFQSPFSLSISRIVGWSIPPNSVPSLWTGPGAISVYHPCILPNACITSQGIVSTHLCNVPRLS